MNEGLEIAHQIGIESVKLSRELEKRRSFAMANQILRAGTSIGANMREAQSPESRRDFIHKMKIADKELRESQYWFKLLEDLDGIDLTDLKNKTKSLERIISKSIATASKRST